MGRPRLGTCVVHAVCRAVTSGHTGENLRR